MKTNKIPTTISDLDGVLGGGITRGTFTTFLLDETTTLAKVKYYLSHFRNTITAYHEPFSKKDDVSRLRPNMVNIIEGGMENSIEVSLRARTLMENITVISIEETNAKGSDDQKIKIIQNMSDKSSAPNVIYVYEDGDLISFMVIKDNNSKAVRIATFKCQLN